MSDLIPLTPCAPSGGPATGAGTPCHDEPPLKVAASDVQMSGLGPVQCPGVPAWPMTQPVLGDTNVTDEAAKLAGTAGGPAGVVAAGGDGVAGGVLWDGVAG